METDAAKTARQRLLEQEDGPSDYHTEHHHFDTAGGATRRPLPGCAYSRDGSTLSQGRLPPLQRRTGSASAGSATSSPLLLPLPALKESFPSKLGITKPRLPPVCEDSQQQPKRQRLDSGTGEESPTPFISSASKPPNSASFQLSSWGFTSSSVSVKVMGSALVCHS